MYTPKFNRVSDRALLIETMRAYSFAVLIGPQTVSSQQGPAQASHLPLTVKDEGEHGVLEGHFARANPHWKSVAGQETLVVFNGPHSYVSPTLYAESLSVPTWNYIAIHACGTLSLVEEEVDKDTVLKGLIESHEPGYSEKWRQMPDGFRRSMLAGIVGFRIPITRIEGKFKISQNRPEADRRSVQAAHGQGDSDQRALAAWMERLSG